MGNYIYLNGTAMYIFLGLLIFILVASLVLAKAYDDEKENNQKLKNKIRNLKIENAELKDQIYKNNFNLPK